MFVCARNPWEIPLAGMWKPLAAAPTLISLVKSIYMSRRACSQFCTRKGIMNIV